MSGLIRLCLRVIVGISALLSGCSGAAFNDAEVVPTYGVPPPEHDPTVVITVFTYQPAGVFNSLEQELTFEVTLNKPTDQTICSVAMLIGNSEHPYGENTGAFAIVGNDCGIAPDRIADDGIWAGSATQFPQGSYDALPVVAHITWYDDYVSADFPGPPIDIYDPDPFS